MGRVGEAVRCGAVSSRLSGGAYKYSVENRNCVSHLAQNLCRTCPGHGGGLWFRVSGLGMHGEYAVCLCMRGACWMLVNAWGMLVPLLDARECLRHAGCSWMPRAAFYNAGMPVALLHLAALVRLTARNCF